MGDTHPECEVNNECTLPIPSPCQPRARLCARAEMADQQAYAQSLCQHHWISQHKPGHIPYWVRVCAICHEPDWDDLDREIRNARVLGTSVKPKILWGSENDRGRIMDAPRLYTQPPPLPVNMWEVTYVEVRHDGAEVILWFSMIPAHPATIRWEQLSPLNHSESR